MKQVSDQSPEELRVRGSIKGRGRSISTFERAGSGATQHQDAKTEGRSSMGTGTGTGTGTGRVGVRVRVRVGV